MMGMGFLRLNETLRKHKWKRSDHEEDVEEFHAREDRLMDGCLWPEPATGRFAVE